MPDERAGIFDLGHIEPRLQIARILQQILLCRADNEPLLPCIDSRCTGYKCIRSARLDLHKEQPFALSCYDVDFSAAHRKIAADDLRAVLHKIPADGVFTGIAGLSLRSRFFHRIF